MIKTKSKSIKLIIMLIVILGICFTCNNVKAFVLTLTPQPDRNAIQLEWEGDKDGRYKIWQLKPGDIEYHSISAIDVYTTQLKTQVLNVHPDQGEWISFNTYDGESITVRKSGNTKQWMEQPNSEDSKGYGRGLIEVTPVTMSEFNKDPRKYLRPDGNGGYFYDIIYIGHWDWNGYQWPNDNAMAAIVEFLDTGRGILCGHDVMVNLPGINHGLTSIRSRFNVVIGNSDGHLGYDLPFSKMVGASRVKIAKIGMLTDTPWPIGGIGTVLSIPYTHQTDQFTFGDVWMTFDGVGEGGVPTSAKYNFYVTSWNNTALIQTGHSNGAATSDEQKVLANALFYLKQLTTETFTIDNSARDYAAPNLVKEGYFTDSFVFKNPGDNGSLYKYYVENLKNGTKSAVKNSTITTGVAGYAYVIDDNPNTTNVPKKVMTKKESIYLVGIPNVNGKWIHIRTIDRAGNYSGVAHFQIRLGYSDLSLRQFVSGIERDGRKSTVDRTPQVDANPIRNGGTTANYNHSKSAQWVKRNDIITYTIRIYNEGNFKAYANEVTVYLPTGLEFISSTTNKTYGWSIKGNNKISSNYLINKVIDKFIYYDSYGNKKYNNKVSFVDLKLECKVSDSLAPYTILTNLAEITKFSVLDDNGNVINIEDKDSKSNNLSVPNDTNKINYWGKTGNWEGMLYYPGQEDDDDFEKVQIMLTDIKGNVWVDKSNSQPKVQNMLVKLNNITDGTVQYTKTYGEGNYIFKDLPIDKSYTIEFEYDGQTYTKSNKTESFTNENAQDRENLNKRFNEITEAGARNKDNRDSIVTFDYNTRKRSITE